MKKQLRYSWQVLKRALLDFTADNGFKSSAALSFYTLFSFAPIVLITIYIAGLFVDDKIIRDEITNSINTMIGQQAAEGVFVLLDTLRTEDTSLFSLILGVSVLIFSATTIFVMIQGGFNEIYGVRPLEGKKGYFKLLRDRLISMGMIFSLGFILLISLVLDSLVMAFINAISRRYEEFSVILLEVLQNIIILSLAFFVLFTLFRFLPDARFKKRFVFRGALFTTLLLLLGKFGIGWYISSSNLSELAGASSSIIILMLWVYYSSVILFFGAELIKAQSSVSNIPYRADSYARKIKIVEVEERG